MIGFIFKVINEIMFESLRYLFLQTACCSFVVTECMTILFESIHVCKSMIKIPIKIARTSGTKDSKKIKNGIVVIFKKMKKIKYCKLY